MKLFVGYQLCQTDAFLKRILENRDRISEVYFSWGAMPSGRSATGLQKELLPWEAEEQQRRQLWLLAEAGIGLNLLLNANCYGADSLSRSFFQSTGDLVDMLRSEWNLVSVTTTSPVIGRFLRQNFEGLEVRASVNMEIGTPEGMDYLAESFDSFYIQRERNRDMAALRRLRQHCDKAGKKLHLLANSGCLNHCSARQFHDNLVAHEQEIAKRDNAFVFQSACRQYLSDPAHRAKILQRSNWIRPEDLHRYEGIADGVKLATRISPNPIAILEAYLQGSYSGNTLELLEPNYAPSFYPTVLDNRSFPPDYFDIRHNCGGDCGSCGYCESLYPKVTQTLADIYMMEEKSC